MDSKKSVENNLAIKALEAQDSQVLIEFINNPYVPIAEAITGALAVGNKELMMMGGRLVQGVLKGNFFQQLGREVKKLVDEGKISEDYANKKYGFQSLSDFMKVIDNEEIDQDKFEAIKKMFSVLNSVDCPIKEEALRYQLFKIVLSLKSSQLLLLRALYKSKKRNHDGSEGEAISLWLREAAQDLGHNLISLVECDEQPLVEAKIITARANDVIIKKHNRLTDLGLKLGEFLQE